MVTLYFFAEGQLERPAEKIRQLLSDLHRRKLILSTDQQKPSPRNPALDPVLAELQLSLFQLDSKMRELEAEQPFTRAKYAVFARAREIRGDIGQIADLLKWFGARATGEMEAGECRGSWLPTLGAQD